MDYRELTSEEATSALSAAVNKKLREIEAKTGEPLKGIEIKPGCKYLLVVDANKVSREGFERLLDLVRDIGAFDGNTVIWYGEPDALRLFEFKAGE